MTAKHNCETCPVLADARAELRELRRRIRLALREFNSQFAPNPAGVAARAWRMRELLDLRKPLKRGRR